LGSVIAGVVPLFEMSVLTPDRLMLLCGIALVIYFLLLPLVKSLVLLLLISAVIAITWAWMDVRANAVLFAVWGEQVVPWLQACVQ
jgi:hypothetical protein